MSKIIEATVGAVRHVMEKHGIDGYLPVGFAVTFYNPDSENKWMYDVRPIIEPHIDALQNPLVRERINLANEFLATFVKQILEGHLDDMIQNTDNIAGDSFQVPGMFGNV